MDFIKFSPFFPSELRQGLPSALYFLLLAFTCKPPSVLVARPRLVPLLQPPPSAFAFLVVLAILVVILPVLVSFSSKTFTVGKILWEGRHPLPPQPLGLDDLVLLPGKGYTDRCFCRRRTGPWAPDCPILKKHRAVCVNRKVKNVSWKSDEDLVDEIPPYLPTPQSPDAESRDKPAKSVSFDPVPEFMPTRKEVDISSVAQPDELHRYWQECVMFELVRGHAKRELRDIGQRDSDGDMEMDDAPRKKVRWNPEVSVGWTIPNDIRDHWSHFVLRELIEQPPKLRPPPRKVRFNLQPKVKYVDKWKMADSIYFHWNNFVLRELIELPPQLRPVSKEPLDGNMG
ncbi:uncharacterized protein J3D65DRAFT_600474 [Phyllosticta citribraziliensis]|uniref:Uncharacterized protein n=1 Tax=Phyllosticta citribraziliensis TaxID=989973 RepID=A0ABR1M741_9PEZI